MKIDGQYRKKFMQLNSHIDAYSISTNDLLQASPHKEIPVPHNTNVAAAKTSMKPQYLAIPCHQSPRSFARSAMDTGVTCLDLRRS